MTNVSKRRGNFSWEQPIEQEILEFCNNMAKQFREAESHHKENYSGLFGFLTNNSFPKELGATAMVYETVAEHIVDRLKLRKKIKK